MSNTVSLLDFLYQNAKMGQETLRHMIDAAADEDFKETLEDQLRTYTALGEEITEMLGRADEEAKPIGTMQRVMTEVSMNANLLIDKTPSHMAEMLMQGYSMGIIDIAKKCREFRGADKAALRLAARLGEQEEEDYRELKRFL